MRPPENARAPAAGNGRGAESAYRAGLRSHDSTTGDPVDRLLPCLDGVRRHGTGWRADCPTGHRSRGALSIAAGDDGRVLLRCWAGCDALTVVQAVGLTLADLFPDRLPDYSPAGRRAAAEFRTLSGWKAALSVLGREATVVAIAARAIRDGDELTGGDIERLAVAIERIDHAREVLA